MSWLWLGVKHKCPYCNNINRFLKYYTVNDGSGFIDIGDYIPNNIEDELGFISADGYCDKCKNYYQCKVGIRKSRLTDIVIFSKLEEKRC